MIKLIGAILFGAILIGFALFLWIQSIKENKEIDKL